MIPPSSRLDPVTLNIVGRTLDAIAEEMGVNLVRGAFSPLIRETRSSSACRTSRRRSPTERTTDRGRRDFADGKGDGLGDLALRQ